MIVDEAMSAFARAVEILPKLADSVGIDVEADSLDPVLLGRGDHDAAVPATEVVEDIPLLDLGQLTLKRPRDRSGGLLPASQDDRFNGFRGQRVLLDSG